SCKTLGMPDGKSSVLAFGPFRLFPTERRLEKDDRRIPAGGRAFDLLVVLIERAGEVVPSRTLMESVWRDVAVEETSLRFHIKNLRKILGDSGPDNRYIRNVRGRGYCFTAPIERLLQVDGRESDSEPSNARSNLAPRANGIIGRSDSIE